MPRPYSADLRERVLLACERREGTREAIARRFRVAASTVYDRLKAARAEGRRGAKPRTRGPAPLGGQGAALARLVAAGNDATLAEYADQLAARTGVRRSIASVCRALKRLGWPRKKRRSGPPSGTVATSARNAPPGARRSPRAASTRPG